MNYPLFRSVCGALAAACVAAPVSASSVRPSAAVSPALGSIKPRTRAGLGFPRKVRAAGSRAFATVSSPIGCTQNGLYIFLGVPEDANYASGGIPSTGSGVAAGIYNEACDNWGFIGSGFQNIVGGDGLSSDNAIVGGSHNEMENANGAFIGAGGLNMIGVAAPYASPYDSAIVGGSYK